MQDLLIDIGIAALLRMLQSKKDVQKWLTAIAKVYTRIEEVQEMVPDLAAAITKKRNNM